MFDDRKCICNRCGKAAVVSCRIPVLGAVYDPGGSNINSSEHIDLCDECALDLAKLLYDFKNKRRQENA